MLGVLVNSLAIVVGGLIGLLFKKAIPEKLSKAIMTGLALCIIYIGISGSLKGQQTLLAVISVVVGAIIGTLIDIDAKLNKLGDWASRHIKSKDGNNSFAEGFVTASLLVCVGAMAIVGSLNAGLLGDNETLFTKSLLDFVSCTMFAASLGAGVIFSAVILFVYQGAIVMLSSLLQPILTDAAIAEITCVGSLLILGLGLNMLGLTKIKVANFLPAVIIAPILCYFFVS